MLIFSSGRLKRQLRILLLAFLLPVTLHIKAAEIITVQGHLKDAQGAAFNGLVTIEFTFYDAATQGDKLWVDILEVEVLDGVFTAYLGMQQVIDETLFETPDRWLGINIGSAGELPQRYRITTSPVAIHANVAESLPPGVIDGEQLITGALTLDKLAPCEPNQIIVMGPSGWACETPGDNP
jgi:hypothetical protein